MKPFALFPILATLLFACGDDDSAAAIKVTAAPGDTVGYDDGLVVVIDGDSYVVTGDPGEDCVMIDEVCVDFAKAGATCKDDAQMDVIIVDGEVQGVICYPPKDDATAISEVAVTQDGQVQIPQNVGHQVIVFDEDSNGTPIPGDVRIDAEQTSLYGNGIEETTIAGNLFVESNNSNVRSLTVDGNVEYTSNANRSGLAFCRINGDLTVLANNFVGLDCIVHGNVTVSGKNALLVGFGVAGNWDIDPTAVCDGCYSFEDSNDDGLVADSERGDPLSCQGGGR
ncbi:MAG: hypothetical protein RBU37_05410 [Myxococcota bacterium]|jgi:hypothetical protein|nr:hypothetical protein [Myxococcota bacterium]